MMIMETLEPFLYPAWLNTWHQTLPDPFSSIISWMLLEHVERADEILIAIIVVLLTLCILQMRAFSRPPPVPLKKLPKRPAVSIQFQPDDPTTVVIQQLQSSKTVVDDDNSSSSHNFLHKLDRLLSKSSRKHRPTPTSQRGRHDSSDVPFPEVGNTVPVEAVGHYDTDHEEEENDDSHDNDSQLAEAESTETPFLRIQDLPDSFAPLLSSSHTKVLTQSLTADLIHGLQVTAGVRLRHGRHEILLDKDASRPQLQLDVPLSGCKLSAVVVVGSDCLSNVDDLNVNIPTSSRSQPMVKHAGVSLDPPLPLWNVAPTLIHFPTLFEDRQMLPTLRSIQLVRFFMDFVVSTSSFLEKCLWILESQCQICLGKVRVLPIYKGATSDRKSPDWRLQLSFSGHVLLFGWIPIPFVSVTLPTFIIPQPHALLEHLLSQQPLASATLKRENIAEERIAVSIINTAEAWNIDAKVVATPPAVGVDVTLPGGVSFAVECGLWRDHYAGRHREAPSHINPATTNKSTAKAAQHNSSFATFGAKTNTTAAEFFDDSASINSMSSWTTRDNVSRRTPVYKSNIPIFDANHLVPWLLELSAKGTISREKMSFHVLKLAVSHEGSPGNSAMLPVERSQLGTRGSFAVWKHRPDRKSSDLHGLTTPLPRARSTSRSRKTLAHPELENEDSPSVTAILLFPDETSSFRNEQRMLQYDYVFDVFDDSKLDAVTVSIGASHPMLNGGTMVTTILDSIYAFGSIVAREDSVLDPIERRRKRNILRHLPATDFTFGIQNIFIPPESDSYSNDGQSLFLPEIEGGRMMLRFLGGMDAAESPGSGGSQNLDQSEFVTDGIKLVADFEIPSLVMNSDTFVKEFPELDILEGVKLHTHLSGVIGGTVKAHLRPQKMTTSVSTTGPNVFNPLEAYEIDFSRSSLTIKMREFSNTLGHRRVMFPAESTFQIKVIESVVDMGFEGTTRCDLSWDFQGLSPMLQVTSQGESPADVFPENKVQVSLLISPLRQGRFSLCVSSVGGISVTKAATTRDDKEGLYDWKFFNAILTPDEESFRRIWNVIHDKRTMEKLLQIVKVLNKDLHRMLRYCTQQLWRAKEILDSEGVSDPKHAIPMFKMSRLISLFLTGDVDQVDTILPIMRRVIDGEGLDVVQVKELLRKHLDFYDTWAPEMDRMVRWAAVAFGPVSVPQPFVEDNVAPLAQLPQHADLLHGIPSASELYNALADKPQLPLDPNFSNLVSRVAPYLTFKQIEYILGARPSTDWQSSDLRRIRYVYSVKRKVQEIAESYGGLSFLPQSFFLSVFLGEATRTSLRASRSKLPRLGSRSFAGSTPSRALRRRRVSSSRRATSSTLGRLRETDLASQGSGLEKTVEEQEEQTPAGRVTSLHNFVPLSNRNSPPQAYVKVETRVQDPYEFGDSLLGPKDVAILFQAGLASVMKSSSVVQLNQRMLLDLICSQPHSFAVAFLAEIADEPRSLASALMSLLELDQTAFKPNYQIDLHVLLETWFPEIKIPRREDHMAGGRWARQSYYEAIYAVALRISEDTEPYKALRSHVQRVRLCAEHDPLPEPRREVVQTKETSRLDSPTNIGSSRLLEAKNNAVQLISKADEAGNALLGSLLEDEVATKQSAEYRNAVALYNSAFAACAEVLSLDKHAFHSKWFSDFYKRNYDALMVKSMFDNVIQDIDRVRHWFDVLYQAAKHNAARVAEPAENEEWEDLRTRRQRIPDDIFVHPDDALEQELVDAILDSIIYEEEAREILRSDPLLRLLIPNPPGFYDFVVISAAGVVTEGKQGTELKDAFERLEKERGIKVIRADTATARSIEYNASKIEEAVEAASKMKKPFGLLGYSQGCANALLAESNLNSGTPSQRRLLLKSENGGLVCRQFLFSAANGSFHGPAVESKIHQLISMCEDFFKSQSGYFSRAFSSTVLEILNSLLDSPHFHKTMGVADIFLPEGCREFWREAQHLSDVPTCTLRGVLEEHTTPESLEMMSNLLAKQSGSPLHDSQVHVFDAVGYPVYHINRNGRVLKRCAVGDGAIQRTHHWSPLSFEVEFVRTARDIEMASFDCAKDRHVFPWIEVNKRFGFIKELDGPDFRSLDAHPSKLITNGGGAERIESIRLKSL